MQWIYITFRVTSFHASTELNIRQKPIIILILWLSVLKKKSNVASLMKTILCVCQLQIANTVAIKFSHPLMIYSVLIRRTVCFLNVREKHESVSLIVLIV